MTSSKPFVSVLLRLPAPSSQKALMAGIPLLAAVSAPSSLAADLASEMGLTLVGFLRESSMVIYAGAERIVETRVKKGSAA